MSKLTYTTDGTTTLCHAGNILFFKIVESRLGFHILPVLCGVGDSLVMADIVQAKTGCERAFARWYKGLGV